MRRVLRSHIAHRCIYGITTPCDLHHSQPGADSLSKGRTPRHALISLSNVDRNNHQHRTCDISIQLTVHLHASQKAKPGILSALLCAVTKSGAPSPSFCRGILAAHSTHAHSCGVGDLHRWQRIYGRTPPSGPCARRRLLFVRSVRLKWVMSG